MIRKMKRWEVLSWVAGVLGDKVNSQDKVLSAALWEIRAEYLAETRAAVELEGADWETKYEHRHMFSHNKQNKIENLAIGETWAWIYSGRHTADWVIKKISALLESGEMQGEQAKEYLKAIIRVLNALPDK
jgi:hypothetical protein